MKKYLYWLAVFLGLLFVSVPASAHTTENALFTCEGELMKSQGNDGKGYYAIVESWKEDEPRANYDIADKAVRQVLAVCHVGDLCTVAAKGERGNGPSYIIQKVFEAQRQPASVLGL